MNATVNRRIIAPVKEAIYCSPTGTSSAAGTKEDEAGTYDIKISATVDGKALETIIQVVVRDMLLPQVT